MNLFFVHTPFQLVVAQGIIRIEGLRGNILIMGSTGINQIGLYEIYDMMIIKGLWEDEYKIGDLHALVFNLSSPLSLWKVSEKIRYIKNIVNEKQVKSIFFGDINHLGYILLAKYFEKLRVSFFEEGTSHYSLQILRKKRNRTLLNKIKKRLYESIVRPFLGVNNLSSYVQTFDPIDFDFNIFRRYNLLERDIIKEYDYKIDSRDIFNLGIENHMFASIGKRSFDFCVILFLSSTIRNLFLSPIQTEVNILNRIKNENEDIPILIKFHPKDEEIVREEIKKELRIKNVPFVEFPFRDEYPVEIFFTRLNIYSLYGYGSSSQLYFNDIKEERIPNKNILELVKLDNVSNGANREHLNRILINWKILQKKIIEK